MVSWQLFYADERKKQPLEIEFLDSSNTKNIISLYKRAIDKHASFIAGPLAKKNVDALLADGDISVPTLALNYSRSRTSHSHLFQFGLSPLDEARQASRIRMAIKSQSRHHHYTQRRMGTRSGR